MPNLEGTSGVDTIDGKGAADTITGFASGDTIYGGKGDDLIFGDFGFSAPGVDGTPLVMSFANVQPGSETATTANSAQVDDSIVYQNMATLDDGTVVAGRLTLVGTTDSGMPIDLGAGEGFEILLNSGANNSSIYEDDYATFTLEFFDQATGDPVVVNSVITFNDLDANSATDTEDVRIDGASFTSYGISSTSNLDVATDGSTVTASGTQGNSPSDQVAWFSATFENKSAITFELSPRTTQSGFSLNGSVIDNPDVSEIPQGDDVIDAGEGNDEAYGGGGNDQISGGEHNDTLFGDDGNDQLFGGTGSDTLDGGEGTDTLDGGEDDDDLIVGNSDTAFGGGGDDVFTIDDTTGDTGDITIVGGETDEGGADTTNGGAGDVLDLSALYADGKIVGGSLSFTPGDPESGSVQLTDGTTITFSEIENFICFARGTMILTEEGDKPVEELMLGDRVMTRDNGFQELRWVGSRKLPAMGKMAPIVIKSGALGNTRDLAVSPQHRMLVEGWKAEMLFGEEEVLVAAKYLVNGDTIYERSGGMIEYFHLLFTQHEIVYANGCPSESFHPGDEGINALTEDAREEILTLFPELNGQFDSYGPTVRPGLKAHQAAALVENPEFLAP